MELNLLGWAGAAQRSGGRPMPAAKPGAGSSTPRRLAQRAGRELWGVSELPPSTGYSSKPLPYPTGQQGTVGAVV